MMISLQRAEASLKEILDLHREPVAVKFLEKAVPPEGFELPDDCRYCQALMGATKGERLLLTAEHVSCPAAAWALGFKRPPDMLSSGEMPARMGIFETADAARHTLASMSRLQMGKYGAVACCPLAGAPFEPDVVVLESAVEHLMWVALALVYGTGGRLTFDTAILQATCVDVTIIPFLQQRLNASLGCYGCREATDLAEGECVLGFPIANLETVVASLERLNERAIPRVRAKPVYRALVGKGGLVPKANHA